MPYTTGGFGSSSSRSGGRGDSGGGGDTRSWVAVPTVRTPRSLRWDALVIGGFVTTLRIRSQAESYRLKLEYADHGSGRKIPAIWHVASAYPGVFYPRNVVLKTEWGGLQSYSQRGTRFS